MTSTKPQVAMDGLYESKQTCEALGISRSCLAKYARSGMIAFSTRRLNGRRVFKGADVIKLWHYVY